VRDELGEIEKQTSIGQGRRQGKLSCSCSGGGGASGGSSGCDASDNFLSIIHLSELVVGRASCSVLEIN
jgi:hypothetical protein